MRDILPYLLRSEGALVLVVPETCDVSLVAGGVAVAMGGPRILDFIGGFLDEADQVSILSDLLAGESAVCACSSLNRATPILNFAQAWKDWRGAPGRTFSSVANFCDASPLPPHGSRGDFVVVVSRAVWPADRRDLEPFFLGPGDAHALAGRGDGVRLKPIGREPHVAGAASIREVFQLPRRDPAGTPAREVDALMGASDRLTWTDLYRGLRDLRERHSFWSHARSTGRMDDEKWAFIESLADAIDLRRDTEPRGMGVFVAGDVWEMVWQRRPRSDRLYRGQFDATWPLRPSLLRAAPGAAAPSMGELAGRMAATRHFVKALRRNRDTLFSRPPEDLDLLAVAQHYGFPSPLVDFTRSHDVAAFFATSPPRDFAWDREIVGVVYSLNPELRDPAARWAGMQLNPFELAGVAPGHVPIITPPLRPEDDRPGRQQGAFVSGHRLPDLRRLLTETWYFRQRPGDVFEDPLSGVDAATLLPDKGAVALLAQACWDACSRKRTIKIGGLDDLLLHDHEVIGSVGERLGWHANFQPRLLAEIEASLLDLPSEAARGVRAAITRFFEAARAEALALPVPPSEVGKHATKPLYDALMDLARATGTDGKALWGLAGSLNPSLDADALSEQAGAVAGEQGPNGSLTVRVVLLLMAWDTLRRVDGEHSVTLIMAAGMVADAESLGLMGRRRGSPEPE